MAGRDAQPWTLANLARPAEAEPGREIHFCPILNLPIAPELRVRALPGFHLMSLDAGKEALARGSYDAYGESYQCQSLEYLHPDDKVFICAEDNKAFLNEMSMRYHRYIAHELTVRKAERKRLRDRAEELKVRRNKQRQQAAAQAQGEQCAPAATEVFGRPQTGEIAPTAAATQDAPPNEPVVTEDPYGLPTATGSDPYLTVAEPHSTAPGTVAPESAHVGGSSPLVEADSQEPERGAVSVATTTAVPAADDDEDDLYGNDGCGKRQKPASSYATAIGAMLGDDFDDDD